MPSGPPRRRWARPVPEAPTEALLPRSEDLAKGWLLALLERAPLDDAPRILAADLAQEGPRVCEAMVRAIADDSDQQRLRSGGALAPLAGRIGELAGAAGAAATSAAVDALQAVVWAALRSELGDPEPELINALAERLAQVTELMRGAALESREGPDARPDGPGPASIPEPGATAPPPPVAGRRSERPRRQPAPEPDRAWVGAETPAASADALWAHALEDEIRQSSGSQLSLVLVELEDSDRLLAVEGGLGSSATFGEFARAVRRVMRRQDILVCETDSRAWIISRDTGRGGAQALGSRISAAVREGPGWRGAPMVASIGVAVFGEDGRTPAELIDAAERARFAAAASGIDVIRVAPIEDPADE